MFKIWYDGSGKKKGGGDVSGKKILAAALTGLFLVGVPTAAYAPTAFAAVKQEEGTKKKPPRQKGGKPEVLTYERAMEIENKRHEDKLDLIWKSYKHHPPKYRAAVQRENAFHAKRVEEIKKKFGMA